MSGTDEMVEHASVDHDALAALVPQLAIELSDSPGNIYRQIDGSMLSADISGFTALTERLADKGKEGAEAITKLINQCFTALIDSAREYGGEVIKFGGDAVLVIFRGDDHMIRAAAAGVAMQEALGNSSAAKKAKLSMTVGVAEGPFDVFLVGSTTRDLLISGAAASHVIELEAAADQGKTLVSTGILDSLPNDVLRVPKIGGFELDEPIAAARPGPVPRSGDIETINFLVPANVRQHFDAFAAMGGEHRIVTVGFLSVSGIDDLLERTGGDNTALVVGELIEQAQSICEQRGVTPLHTDIAPDGFKYLLCAGAPVSRGHAADSMLEAAIEIARLDSPLTIKMGVQHGRVFAGFLGSPYRRTYTLMGDVVNTAARMLGKAERGDVIAVDEVFDHTRSVFVTNELEPFLVKGKIEPISASRVVGTSAANKRSHGGLPLIGRETQLRQVAELRATADSVILLSGPAGAGKSRLLDAVRGEALAEGFEIVGGNCSPYSRATPYALLRMVLRDILDIDTFSDPETAGDVLHKMIEIHAPELAPMAPVIAIPVGAIVEETPESKAIDKKFLRSQINRTAADLVRATFPARSLLILEDIHWIDDPSAEFFDHLLTTDSDDEGRSTILTTRPDPEWTPEIGARLAVVTVDPLTDDDIKELAIASSTRDLTDAQLDSVVDKADGNPLFAIELAKAVGLADSTDVPDTVEQLISARIDGLEPDQRHGLRVASVFGYRLRADDLEIVLEPLPALNFDELSEFVVAEDDNTLVFTHALYREVAYEGLPYAERRRLHARVGQHLEQKSADAIDLASLLSFHFYEAGDAQRTWTYGVIAGDVAVQQAATVDAARSYRRALGAAPRLRNIDSQAVVRVALALGDSSSLLGEFDAAEKAYAKARSATDEIDSELNAMMKIGRLREMQGNFSQAHRWYERTAAKVPEGDRTTDILQVRSRLHFYRSGLLHRKNDQQGCIIEARRALGAAEDANDVEGMAEALQRLHLATVYLGRKDVIGYGSRALQLFTELERYERQSVVLNNLGIEHYFNEQWVEAADFYRRSTEAGLKAGSMIEGMLGALNSGEILSDQGHWGEAIVLLESARRNWENGRFPIGAAMAKLYLGVAHDRRGDRAEAAEHLKSALQALAELGLQDEVLDVRSRLIVHRASLGATVWADVDAMLVELPEDHALRPRLIRAKALDLAVHGEWPEARRSLFETLEDTKAFGRALTLRLLTAYDPDPDPEWQTETDEIRERLGIVSFRVLPTPKH